MDATARSEPSAQGPGATNREAEAEERGYEPVISGDVFARRAGGIGLPGGLFFEDARGAGAPAAAVGSGAELAAEDEERGRLADDVVGGVEAAAQVTLDIERVKIERVGETAPRGGVGERIRRGVLDECPGDAAERDFEGAHPVRAAEEGVIVDPVGEERACALGEARFACRPRRRGRE